MNEKKMLYRMFRVAPRGCQILEIAGQLGRDKDGELVEGFEPQVLQALTNLSSVLLSAGVEDLSQVLKIRVFVADADDPKIWATFNEIYEEWVYNGISAHLPTRSAFSGNGLPIGALVEIEATAYLE